MAAIEYLLHSGKLEILAMNTAVSCKNYPE
jgi:hypothetical protein